MARTDLGSGVPGATATALVETVAAERTAVPRTPLPTAAHVGLVGVRPTDNGGREKGHGEEEVDEDGKPSEDPEEAKGGDDGERTGKERRRRREGGDRHRAECAV